MRSRPSKLLAVLYAVVAVVALSACGDWHTKVTTGTYAASRAERALPRCRAARLRGAALARADPTNEEDAAYLKGLSAEQGKLGTGEEWFAVFVQVYNDESTPHLAATDITISDTAGNTYSPIVPEQDNAYAYRGGTVAGKAQLPPADTTADLGPPRGP